MPENATLKTFGADDSLAWQVVSEEATVYERFHWVLDTDANDGTYIWVKYKYRERTTRTYQKVVGAEFQYPSQPVNPDSLSTWRCVNRVFQRGYGETMGTYTEVYEILGSWQTYTETE